MHCLRVLTLRGASPVRPTMSACDFGFAAMRNWVARVVLGVRYPGLPFAFLIEANPLGEAARLLVTLHKVNVTSQHQICRCCTAL